MKNCEYIYLVFFLVFAFSSLLAITIGAMHFFTHIFAPDVVLVLVVIAVLSFILMYSIKEDCEDEGI